MGATRARSMRSTACTTPEKSSPACDAERLQVGGRARRWRRASGTPRRQRAGRSEGAQRRRCAGRGVAAPRRERPASADVSTAVCERIPIATPASSARDEERRVGRQAPAPIVRPRPATSASAHIAAANAEHVAQRPQRREPEQRRGRRRRASPTSARRSRPSRRRKNSSERRKRGGAGERAPDRQAARRGGVDTGRRAARGRHLRQRDEDRIAGRMRLVPRDVELPHAEREVDRVEVFERSRQEREVRERGRSASSATPADRWRHARPAGA